MGTVLVLGLVFLSRHDTESGHVPMVLALVVLAVSSRLLRGREFRWNRRRLAWAILGAWAVPAAALLAASGSTRDQAWAKSLIERCRFAAIPADDVERLAVWCRDHTPASARFIGPPGPKTFRLWSLRSVAFNRAASPYHAAGLADWSSRFRDHVGFDGSSSAFVRAYLADRHGLERRYQSMSDSARAALAERQGATHVVAAAPEREVRDRADSPLELLHVEGRYAVYRVRPPEEVAFHGTMSWERSRQDFGLVQFRGFLGNRYGSPWPWDFPREVEAPAETTVNGDARSNSAGASFSRSRTKPGIEPGLDFPFSDFFSRW